MVQNGRILVRLETLERDRAVPVVTDGKPYSLPVGAVMHDFELPLLTGGSMTLSEWRGRRFLLIFVDPVCSYCQSLASRRAATPALPTLIISSGDPEHNRALFAAHALAEGEAAVHVLLQEDIEVAELFRIENVPSGYLVDEHGAAGSELLSGAGALLSAMTHGIPEDRTSRLVARPSEAATQLHGGGLKAGARAPVFTLPQVDGKELSLSDFSGQNVLLVFSDPGCAPCLALAPKLELIHRGSPDLRVLMISRGNVQVNCDTIVDLSLTFPVVLQRHWEISRAYGKIGTPAGFRIGRDGCLASDVAVGESGILGLVAKTEREEHLEQTV